MTRILIADDHAVVRSGLRHIIAARPDWSVVAEAADGKQAIDGAIASRPDLAILDYSLPLIDGIEAARQIRLRVPTIEILIFTMHDSEDLIFKLLKAGARGYLLKTDAAQYLTAAIEALAAHRPFFTDGANEVFLKTFLTSDGSCEEALTARERSIAQLIGEGHSNKQMADVLNLSVKTIEAHRATLMRKVGAHSAAALVRYAIRHNIIEP
jgi:DNA-binding NarL/FixJ family response regulator